MDGTAMDEPARPRIGAVPADAPPLSTVRRLRHRHIIDRLDYLRALRRLAATMTQSDLARELGITQPSVSSALKSAAKVADPPAGFVGASVYEIAQRFTVGELGRDELLDQLSRWPDPAQFDRLTDPDDDHTPLPGLSRALRDRLLDEQACRVVLDRRKQLGRPTAEMPTNAASGE